MEFVSGLLSPFLPGKGIYYILGIYVFYFPIRDYLFDDRRFLLFLNFLDNLFLFGSLVLGESSTNLALANLVAAS